MKFITTIATKNQNRTLRGAVIVSGNTRSESLNTGIFLDDPFQFPLGGERRLSEVLNHLPN